MSTPAIPNHHTHVNVMENGKLVWKPREWLEDLKKQAALEEALANAPAEENGGTEETESETEEGTPEAEEGSQSEPAAEVEPAIEADAFAELPMAEVEDDVI